MVQLEIQELSFLDYGPFDLSIESGQVFGVSGPSGSGKTLFIKAVADLITSPGRIYLDGRSREDLLDEPTANLDEKNTGLVEACILGYLKANGGVAIWVSHNREQLHHVANRQAAMIDKHLIEMEVSA